MKEKLQKQEVPYAQVANVVLKDKRLSLKAKGLFAYIYSKFDNWDFAASRIALECTDGERAIQSGLKELELLGYLTRKRRADGRVIYYATYDPDLPKRQNSIEAKQHYAETALINKTDLNTNTELNNAGASPAKVDRFFNKNPTDEILPMTLEEFVLMCRGSAYRHVRILAEYADDRRPPNTTRGQWRAFGLRNMRTARRLTPYSDRQLTDAMTKLTANLKENGGFISKWTLETLEKHLEEA